MSKVKWEAQDVMGLDSHLERLLWSYCHGHAGFKVNNDQADTPASKAFITNAFRMHKATDITPYIPWMREAHKELALDYLSQKDKLGPP